MNTNVTLPDSYYSAGEEVRWWILSAPPYYCQNGYPTGQDFSSNKTWLGVSMWNGVNLNTQQTSGIKYAFTRGLEPVAEAPPGGDKVYYISDAVGTGQILANLNIVNGAWNTPSGIWGLQDTFYPGKNVAEFGPYDLNKTTDTTPYPDADGDIIIITTGSDVLGGAIEAGGAFGAGDFRIWNLLFYSTGSSNITDLVTGVFSNSAASALSSYAEPDRYNYFTHGDVAGSMAFVAVPSTSNPNALIWWPITWQDTDPRVVMSRNDA